MVVFLDSYAIIEIDKGNKAFAHHSVAVDRAVTTPLNLMEVYYFYLRLFGRQEAEMMYERTSKITQQLRKDVLQEGCRFKLENKKKKMSYADCIGYAFAIKEGIPFVTGDKEFKNLPGVEFLK